MPPTRYSKEEVARRGQEFYRTTLRPKVETPQNIGKLISIDIETGDYEIDDDILHAVERLRQRHPDAETWTERIGYNAVYAVGGARIRTAE